MRVHADTSTGRVARVTMGAHSITGSGQRWKLDGKRPSMTYRTAVERLYFTCHNEDGECACSICCRFRRDFPQGW